MDLALVVKNPTMCSAQTVSGRILFWNVAGASRGVESRASA